MFSLLIFIDCADVYSAPSGSNVGVFTNPAAPGAIDLAREGPAEVSFALQIL